MNVKEKIHRHFVDALKRVNYGDDSSRIILEQPRHKEHGDIACPIAMGLARELKKNPLRIAEDIVKALEIPSSVVVDVEVAKPGYINMRVAHGALTTNLRSIDDNYGGSDLGGGTKCQVEFVSTNPTGPLVVVSARAAAVGSVMVNLLCAIGYDAQSEYYVNDFGNQVQALGETLRYRVREHRGTLESGEELGAYPGDYLKEIAAGLSDSDVNEWEGAPNAIEHYGKYATRTILAWIKRDLGAFGVEFDNFFLESSLHPEKVKEARDSLEKNGHTYEEDGALFFKTTDFDVGDEKDRVIVKSDGKPTYFLGDIAYHKSKYDRGHKWVVDLLGPDHHGHIPRMRAASQAFGAGKDWFNALVVGWVRLVEGGKQVSMSKRAGQIIMMRELIDDVGADVAKYFFLMRRANSPLDFDLDLARKQSDENPVYYVQYAHARIASIARHAEQQGLVMVQDQLDLARLDTAEERDLMVHLLFFPYVVEGAALAYEPHRLASYSEELAALFHRFYHERRVVGDDQALSAARFFLVKATKQVLKNALRIMGVGAPESM